MYYHYIATSLEVAKMFICLLGFVLELVSVDALLFCETCFLFYLATRKLT